MPYLSSSRRRKPPASSNLLQQLLSSLQGGGGNIAQSLSQPDFVQSLKQPDTSQFFSPVAPGLEGAPGGIIDPSGLIQDYAQQQQQPDYLQQFLMSMAQDIGQTGTGLNQADYEEALKNSAAQIKGAFGAEIGAVKASSMNARHQTKRSKKQIKAMYNALGRQYDKGAAKEVAQGQQIANAIQNVANTSTNEVKGNSDQLLNEQAALAQNLGVQSALPDVTAAQQSAVAKQVGNIQQSGARAATDQLSNSGSQQRYLVRGGKNALLEGTNRRADLVQQLQAFLQQNMGKIADIQGQQGQALAANTMSAAKSFGAANSDAQQQKWGREKDLASLLMSLRGQQASQDKQNAYGQQQSTNNLMDLLKLLSSSAASTQDPNKMAEVYKLIQGALQAQAGG